MFARFNIPFGGSLSPVGGSEAPPASTYEEDILSTGPVALWMLDGSLEEAVAGRTLSLGAGAESYTGGIVSGVNASFNCAGANWLTRTHHADLKPAVGTIMSVCRAASLHDGWIVSADSAGLNDGDFSNRLYSDGTIGPYFQSVSAPFLIRTADVGYAIGQTVFAFVTFSSAGFRLFLKGSTQDAWSSTGYTSGLGANTTDWRFGFTALAGVVVFDGTLGPQAIWNRVLTRAEMEFLSQITAPPTP